MLAVIYALTGAEPRRSCPQLFSTVWSSRRGAHSRQCFSASLRARNLTVAIHQVLVMRDPHNHQSRGFGFITFQRDESAKQVLQNRYHDMMGKRVSSTT